MYYHGTNDPEEEVELLQQRENVEKALLAYQRLYMSSEILQTIQHALGSKKATPIEVMIYSHYLNNVLSLLKKNLHHDQVYLSFGMCRLELLCDLKL